MFCGSNHVQVNCLCFVNFANSLYFRILRKVCAKRVCLITPLIFSLFYFATDEALYNREV